LLETSFSFFPFLNASSLDAWLLTTAGYNLTFALQQKPACQRWSKNLGHHRLKLPLPVFGLKRKKQTESKKVKKSINLFKYSPET